MTDTTESPTSPTSEVRDASSGSLLTVLCREVAELRAKIDLLSAVSPQTDSAPPPLTTDGRDDFAGHTPGPWKVYGHRRGGPIHVRCADGTYVVAPLVSRDREAPDARLIAAAPDLLRENTELRATLAQKDEEIKRLRAALQSADYGSFEDSALARKVDGAQ